MITERDLQEAIAECLGKRDPNANDCIKLAAFYTIRDQLYPSGGYSYAPPPEPVGTVDCPGDSDFARVVDGRKQSEVWPVMEELMVTLEAINPRLYDAVMRKLQ